MISLFIGILLGVIIGLAYLLHKARKEVRYRDKHLEWVDRRDVLLTALFTRVSEARFVPMTNPLDGVKQHGMITRNAVTPTYLAEMDERLTYTQGFLKRAIAAAKEIEVWEARNPAPPVRPGEERAADVSKPMPVGVPAHDQFVDEPKAIGEGAFGSEVDERPFSERMPKRPIRDNPQA